jgi:hypothetical protein
MGERYLEMFHFVIPRLHANVRSSQPVFTLYFTGRKKGLIAMAIRAAAPW